MAKRTKVTASQTDTQLERDAIIIYICKQFEEKIHMSEATKRMLKKKTLRQHERMLVLSKARAIANISLERPLTDKELTEYRTIMSRLGL